MNLDRRQMLKLTGASAAVSMGGLAGCVDDITGGNGDTPDYARWVAWDEHEEGATAIYVDMRGLDEFDEFDDDQAEPGEEDDLLENDDPMLAVPAGGLFGALLVAGFGLMGTGLGELVDFDRDDDEFDTEVDELLFANEAIVLLGDIDTDEVDETLTEPTEGEFGMGESVYEQTDEIGDFTIYELEDDEDDDDDMMGGGMEQDSAIAVSDDAIIVGDGEDDRDAIDIVRAPIEAENGDGDRAIDVEEEFEWLLETAGNGHVAFGGYGELDEDEDEELEGGEIEGEEGDELDVFEDAGGIVASLTIDSETDWSADMAVSGAELDDDAQAEVEETFGSSASDVSHEFDGDRVTISASWDDDPTE